MNKSGLHVIVQPIFLLTTALFINTSYAQSVKPFWTEKSSYIEGDNLYVVGIASNTPSIEAGRKLAFENGKSEIMNFAQISNLNGLTIKTQMTYEEEVNKKYNVYRLMYVDYDGINSLKSKNIEQTKKNYDRYSQKQEQEIIMKRKALTKLSQNKEELAKLDLEYNKIAQSRQSSSEKAMRYVKVDMSPDEVKSLLGNPRSIGRGNWKYGRYWVIFNDGNTVECLSTTTSCVNYACNTDKTKCKVESKSGTQYSYYNRMFE